MPNIQVHIRHLEDPKVIWETLHRRLDFTASQTGRAAILTKFLNARPNSGENIGEYIARLQNYQTQLHGTKEAITDGLLQSRIFETSPPEFKGLLTNLRDQPDITVEKIMARLTLDEEERRNVSSSSGSALFTSGNQKRGQGRGQGREHKTENEIKNKTKHETKGEKTRPRTRSRTRRRDPGRDQELDQERDQGRDQIRH
jgi:hypothetical protein